jgi:hypothetical protein
MVLIVTTPSEIGKTARKSRSADMLRVPFGLLIPASAVGLIASVLGATHHPVLQRGLVTPEGSVIR